MLPNPRKPRHTDGSLAGSDATIATRGLLPKSDERAGVREIAADAGLTAAPVNRYFGSMEGLFAEVIRRALDLGHLLQRRRGDLADHLARLVVYGQVDSWDRGHTAILLLVDSATEPRAVKLFRRDLNRPEEGQQDNRLNEPHVAPDLTILSNTWQTASMASSRVKPWSWSSVTNCLLRNCRLPPARYRRAMLSR